MRVFVTGLLLFVGAVGARVMAESAPVRGALDSRIRTAAYSPEDVYRLRGVVGYQIDLQFERGESFIGLGSGDIDGLGYVGQDNHLFLKPKAAHVATNLTVLTNRREYQIDYGVLPQRPAEDGDIVYVVRFTYPKAPGNSELDKAVERLEHELDTAPAARPRNVDYWVLRQSHAQANLGLRRWRAYAPCVLRRTRTCRRCSCATTTTVSRCSTSASTPATSSYIAWQDGLFCVVAA